MCGGTIRYNLQLINRKEATWKEVSGARDKDAKGRCMEAYREEKRLKGVYIKAKMK